jgi:hypothetical protein
VHCSGHATMRTGVRFKSRRASLSVKDGRGSYRSPRRKLSKVIAQPQRQPRWAQPVALAIFALALLGVFFLLREVIRAIQGIGLAHEIGVWMPASTKWLGTNGSWIAAIATVAVAFATFFLWRATSALSRSTNVQFASAGPLLVTILTPPEGPPAGLFKDIVPRPYLPAWITADQGSSIPAIAGGGAVPAYVTLYVVNRSQSPHGIAARISIKATLHYGAAGNSGNHPHHLPRTAEIPTCEPGTVFALQLFNVGGLSNTRIEVDEMKYYDLMGRRRRGGWGYAVLTRNANGTAIFPKLFEPRKGEYTDGI